jgi:nucleotide-binding universal stress UspA family protein
MVWRRQEEISMYERALVPLDGSGVAEGVIPFVMEIARPLGLEVTLLRVVTPMPPTVVDGGPVIIEDIDTLRAEAEAYLAPFATELRANGVRARTKVRCGEAVAEILAGARAAKADLIIMTTHGRTGFGRFLFGSVAEAVLRQANLPVFLMHQTDAQMAARAEQSHFAR